jgi:hypothetical protein
MSLYDFLMEYKDGFMRMLGDRNRKNPQQWYDKFFFTDDPDFNIDDPDFNKSNMGLCAQGRPRQGTLENEPETQPDSLSQRIQNLGKKTLKISKNAFGKIFGVQIYEAWASIFCRDARDLSGIEKAVRTQKGWREVKDPKKREMYKGTGDKFYEYDSKWVLTLLCNKENGMNIATIICKYPDQLVIGEYYRQLDVMFKWMRNALEPRQQTQHPRKMPELETELEKHKSYVDNSVVIGGKYPAAFAIRGKEAGLVMGNMPNLSQDLINACVITMGCEGHSACAGNGRLAVVKRLQKKPSKTEAIKIKRDLINYTIGLMKMFEGS